MFSNIGCSGYFNISEVSGSDFRQECAANPRRAAYKQERSRVEAAYEVCGLRSTATTSLVARARDSAARTPPVDCSKYPFRATGVAKTDPRRAGPGGEDSESCDVLEGRNPECAPWKK